MGTCFTTLVPRYESPPSRGWFSATLEYSNLSSTPPRLGRNPSRLRKHFDRLSWRSTGQCRTNVPFSRALLVKQHQNGTTGREMAMRATRGVIARIKMLMERNESGQEVVFPALVRKIPWNPKWNRCPWSESRPTANWLSAENFVRVRCKFPAPPPPPARSLTRPPFTHDMLHGLSRGAGSNSLFPFTRIVFVSRENNLMGKRKGDGGR